MDLSVAIVNWNGHPYLYDCLRSLYETAGATLIFETILVDNASTDNSATRACNLFPQLRLIENAENVGFARANNQAIQMARGDSVLLLNPDTIVLAGATEALLRVLADNPRIGILGPRLLHEDGTIQPSVIEYPSLLSSLTGFCRSTIRGTSKRTPAGAGSLVYAPSLTGAALMVRRAVFQDIGLLDESYFMYAEETDFCYRAHRGGWRIACTTAASIIHLGARSTRRVDDAMYVERRKSRIRFILKHRGRFEALLTAKLIEANLLFRWWVTPSRRSEYARIRSMFRASVYPTLVTGE